MARNGKSMWSYRSYAAFISSFIGLMCCLGLLAVFSAVIYLIMDSLMFMDVFSAISLSVGTFTGSFVYGKFRRHGGMIGGALCGALMYCFVSAAALILCGTVTDIKKLLLLVVFGAAGGVAGVNSKRPGSLRDQ